MRIPLPIVERRVEVNLTSAFDLPFECGSCGLLATAHVTATGEGRARSLYVAPNRQAAHQRAYTDAQWKAQALLWSCACPRCGEHNENQRRLNAEWERTAPGKRRLTKAVCVAIAVLTLFVAIGGCAVGAKSDVEHAFKGGGTSIIGGLLLLAFFHYVLSPSPEPKLLAELPPGFWFSPPETWRTLAGGSSAARARPAVQVAGERCGACRKNIVFEAQGMACEACAAVLHNDCHAAHTLEKHNPNPEVPYRS